MIKIENKEKCTGCNACGDICPKDAISFVLDNEGFWYPKVSEEKCIDCHLCEKICPNLNEKNNTRNFSEPECYIAEHKSIDVVFSSTTGGMFTALADAMYSQGGYVGGAIHNKDFSVSHFISNNKDDLSLLRRSKDLQSNAEGFHKNVKKILDEGNKVLVVGLPCQIAGLKNFLRKDYEDFITVDLICAGINSPKVWRKYLDYIEEKNGSKIVWTENKSKEYGWHNLTQKFVFENGQEYFDIHSTSFFIQGYIDSHIYCRPSCYCCNFKGFPRVADITIGDFWGIEKYKPEYNKDMGTNVVLINSEKGKSYFDIAKKRVNVERANLSWATGGNPALLRPISKLATEKERNDFFTRIDNEKFDSVVKDFSKKKYGIKDYLRKLKRLLRFEYMFVKYTGLNIKAVYQTIRYSGIKNLIKGKGIICCKHCVLNIDKTSKLQFEGLLILGRKGKFPQSKLETRLYVGKNATLKVLGRFDIDFDSNIEVFDNAELVIHGSKLSFSDANAGFKIICGEKIEIMADVGIGRNVMIRDTNGQHYMNTTGYRPSRPVVIGEKAWLCESVTIMPGVKIGRAAIVGVNSTVTKSVPAHALVSGYPAVVVQENVLWKC